MDVDVINWEAPRLIEYIFKRTDFDLQSVEFVAYTPVPGVVDRIIRDAGDSANEILSKANEITKIAGDDLSCWESLLAAAWKTAQINLVLGEAQRHEKKAEMVESMPLAKMSQDSLAELFKRHCGRAVAIRSRCRRREGDYVQLPMMDFRCRPSDDNLEKIKCVLANIGRAVDSIRKLTGAILKSGNSYHFYGYHLLSSTEWSQFIGQCLLAAPLTDTRFVGHRLADGMFNLRINSCDQKRMVPYVVATID
jgi:hypothetical protein